MAMAQAPYLWDLITPIKRQVNVNGKFKSIVF